MFQTPLNFDRLSCVSVDCAVYRITDTLHSTSLSIYALQIISSEKLFVAREFPVILWFFAESLNWRWWLNDKVNLVDEKNKISSTNIRLGNSLSVIIFIFHTIFEFAKNDWVTIQRIQSDGKVCVKLFGTLKILFWTFLNLYKYNFRKFQYTRLINC